MKESQKLFDEYKDSGIETGLRELSEAFDDSIGREYGGLEGQELESALEDVSKKFDKMRELLSIANSHRPGKYKQMYIKRIMSNLSRLRAELRRIEKAMM